MSFFIVPSAAERWFDRLIGAPGSDPARIAHFPFSIVFARKSFFASRFQTRTVRF